MYIYETDQLQIESVIRFMKVFDYTPVNMFNITKGFKHYNNYKHKTYMLSFENAVRLHNGKSFTLEHEDVILVNTLRNKYAPTIRFSKKAKLVDKVKLQRKNGMVHCQDHMIKRVNY